MNSMQPALRFELIYRWGRRVILRLLVHEAYSERVGSLLPRSFLIEESSGLAEDLDVMADAGQGV